MKKTVASLLVGTFFLTGCAAGGGGASSINVGPAMSSSYSKLEKEDKKETVVQKTKLDIIIPAFDANLPKDPADYEKEGIWPELRRAEAVRFAYKMKLALEKTAAFGAVRVIPDKNATGDLYLLGKIDKSNGEEVDLDIEVYDIGGKKWLDKSFDYTVEADFYSNIRNKDKDAYAPIFAKIAKKLVEKLDHQKEKTLTQLQALTEVRFGANFSEENFGKYMAVKKGKVSLVAYPAEDDLMLQRIKSIRVRDQMFVDRMQSHYEQFNQQMDESYKIWQKQSFEEVQAESKASNEAIGKAFAGIGLIALGVLSAVAGSNSNNVGGYATGTTGAIVAGQAGVALLGESAKMNKEAQFHHEALSELGASVDAEMAPQVVEFEATSKSLTGSATEQFSQWRTFLKQMYEQEATPDVQL
ncbi:MAG: hypothetical protein Q9M31_03410 [Mariprofundus sp.]|nr:hypothetical protein [Mariprofundus sp.]